MITVIILEVQDLIEPGTEIGAIISNGHTGHLYMCSGRGWGGVGGDLIRADPQAFSFHNLKIIYKKICITLTLFYPRSSPVCTFPSNPGAYCN